MLITLQLNKESKWWGSNNVNWQEKTSLCEKQNSVETKEGQVKRKGAKQPHRPSKEGLTFFLHPVHNALRHEEC